MSTAAGLQDVKPTAGRERLKVLVIEDDDVIAKLITMIIEKIGPYSVERANSIASVDVCLQACILKHHMQKYIMTTPDLQRRQQQ